VIIADLPLFSQFRAIDHYPKRNSKFGGALAARANYSRLAHRLADFVQVYRNRNRARCRECRAAQTEKLLDRAYRGELY